MGYKINPNAIEDAKIVRRHLSDDALDFVSSEGFYFLGNKFKSIDEIVEKLGTMHSTDYNFAKENKYLGCFLAQYESSFFIILNNCTYYNGDLWVQSIMGNLILSNGKLVHSSNNIGTFVRRYNAEGWSKWEIANNSVMSSESEIFSRLQGTSDNSDSRKDSFKWLGDFNDGTGFTKAYELFNNALDSLTYDKEKIGGNYGYFRANVGNHRQLEIRNLLISSTVKYIIQVVSGCFAIKNNRIVENVDVYTIAARIRRNDTWEEWKVVCDSNTMFNVNNNITAISNEKIRAEQAETELLKRIQGKSNNTNAKTDPFKYIHLGNKSTVKENMERFSSWLDNLYDVNEQGEFINGGINLSKQGYYRIIVNNQSSIEVQIVQISSSLGLIMEIVKGPITISNIGNISNISYDSDSDSDSDFDKETVSEINLESYNIYYRVHYDYINKSTGEHILYWTDWSSDSDTIAEIKSNALISKTLELKGDEQKLELTGSTIDGTTSISLSFPSATSSMAGVMSVEDKEVLNTLNIGSYDTYNDIELLDNEDSEDSEYENYTPARMNNKDLTSGGYFGYKYNLPKNAYNNGYRYIYFRGSNFTVSSDIIRGLVATENHSVESFVKTSEPLTNGWQKLPITPNSKYLKATYTKGVSPELYGEAFTPEYIYLIKTEGVIDSVNYLTENVDIIKQNASLISYNMLNPDDLLNGFTLSSGNIVNNENGIFSNKLYLEVGKNYTLKNLPVYSKTTVKSVFVARYDETGKCEGRDSVTVYTKDPTTGEVPAYNTVVYTPTIDAAYYRVLLQSGFNDDHPFDASIAMIYEGTDEVNTFIPYKPVFVSEYDKMQDEKFSKLNVKNDNVVEQIGNILITGASFAYDGNTWFSKVCKSLGVKGYNKAVSGESIKHAALKMRNGRLYTTEEFENFDTLIIMHVHNQDVCDEINLKKDHLEYETSKNENENLILPVIENDNDFAEACKNLKDSKHELFKSISYSQAYDYVLKKYAAECYAAKDNKDSKWYGTKCGKPFKVVCMTHWHDARTIFNDSIRRLKEKWGFKLIELDKEIGFSKNQVHPVTGTQVSIMHSVDTETIDNIVYGWHPSRDNEPYIQDRIADIVVRTLKR